jgi:hypothetical protein
MVVQSSSAQGKIEGVWKVTEVSMSGPQGFKNTNPQPSLFIFAKKYYTAVGITSDKPRPVQPLEKATDAQKVAAWAEFDVHAGTYEVKGTTLTTHDAITKNPEEMKPGSFGSFDFKIEGNTLMLILKAMGSGPLPNPLTYILVRVE